MNKLLLLSFVVLLSGCALSSATRNMITGQQFDNPVIEQNVYLKKIQFYNHEVKFIAVEISREYRMLKY